MVCLIEETKRNLVKMEKNERVFHDRNRARVMKFDIEILGWILTKKSGII